MAQIEISMGLDLQDMYDQARAMERAWGNCAAGLEAEAGVCTHELRLWKAVGDLTVCTGCDRVVPAYARAREGAG